MKSLSDGTRVPDDTPTTMVDGRRVLMTQTEINDKAVRDAVEIVKSKRHIKARLLRREAVRRISQAEPEWNTYERIEFIASIWNLFGGTPTASQVLAKDIYVFARDTILPAIAVADEAALAAIDPAASEPMGPGNGTWPT